MSVEVKNTGKRKDGVDIVSVTIENNQGMRLECLNLGCIITKLIVPDRNGNMTDVVLGFDDIEDYTTRSPKCGALVGRFANRINGSSFELDGTAYRLEPSRDGYTIHGGPNGYDKRVFAWEQSGENSVTFTLNSPDGDQGFPGALQLRTTYTLTDPWVLHIQYEMICDADTVVNITNHSYFNLSGAGRGDVTDHVVYIASEAFCEADSRGVPTGVMLEVEGTPMDFRAPHAIGQTVDESYPQLSQFGGYDHSFQLSAPDGSVAASAWSPVTGIRMDVTTSMPAVQFYTSNGMHIDNAKDGQFYGRRAGLCFETQYHPDSPNHSQFPSCVLHKDEKMVQQTAYAFSVSDVPPSSES